MIDCEALTAAMGDLNEAAMLETLKGVSSPADAAKAMDACQAGMNIVGKLFETREYYVGDLICAGELMTEAVELLKPYLITSSAAKGSRGKLILCTVRDDLHDIGKNIVRSMLKASGFEVLDLGIDVPPKTIVNAAKKHNIKIVALSGVLTLALESMKETVEAFKAAGMDDVRIIVGGLPVTEDAAQRIGADAWAHAPETTVRICTAWAAQIP